MKQNKMEGITLIALVITIIVLLILAGVTISTLTGDNGILAKAVEAKDKTETAKETEEQMLELLEKQLNEEGKITVSALKVGDYVKYGDKLTAQTYVTKENEEADTGYETSQTFNSDTSTLWRVINKKANGDVEIVAVNSTLSSDDTTGLYFKGENGFLNAETILDNLCSKLYSNPAYGTARSIDVDDINNLTGFNPETSEWEGKDYYLNNRTKTYTSGGPFFDKNSNTFREPTTENPITVEHSYYYYIVDENMPLYNTLIESSKSYNGQYKETNYPMFYWLASRNAHIFTTGMVRYRIFNIGTGEVRSWYTMERFPALNPVDLSYACAIRPIVTLNNDVQIDTSDVTKNGSEEGRAWVLK